MNPSNTALQVISAVSSDLALRGYNLDHAGIMGQAAVSALERECSKAGSWWAVYDMGKPCGPGFYTRR